VPVGSTVGSIPELNYEIDGVERSLRLTGNRLGDNAPQVMFELVEKEQVAPDEEVAPTVELSEASVEEPEQADEAAEESAPEGEDTEAE